MEAREACAETVRPQWEGGGAPRLPSGRMNGVLCMVRLPGSELLGLRARTGAPSRQYSLAHCAGDVRGAGSPVPADLRLIGASGCSDAVLVGNADTGACSLGVHTGGLSCALLCVSAGVV